MTIQRLSPNNRKLFTRIFQHSTKLLLTDETAPYTRAMLIRAVELGLCTRQEKQILNYKNITYTPTDKGRALIERK